jgi:hypothetical protein
VYDPYTEAQTILILPGITNHSDYRIGGIDFSLFTSSIFIGAAASLPFSTSGVNRTGNNKLIRYDTSTNSTTYIVNLETAQDAIYNETGQKVNGFQDMAEDSQGNAYFIATFGGVVVKIDTEGNVGQFYTPPTPFDASAISYTEIAYLAGINKFVVADSSIPGFVSFDSTLNTSTPAVIPITSSSVSSFPIDREYYVFDALYATPKYNDTFLLVSEVGDQVLVFTSQDGWLSGVFKGAVNNTAFGTGGQHTWIVQIGEESIFLGEFFNYDVPKNRSSFPMFDITDLVEELVTA